MIVPQWGWYVPNRYAYVLSLCIYGLSRWNNASAGAARPQWVLHGVSGFGIVSVSVAWTRACLQCRWHVLNGCNMFSASVACPSWVWYALRGGTISPVGVSMASIGVFMASVSVAWPLCIWHVRSSTCENTSVRHLLGTSGHPN